MDRITFPLKRSMRGATVADLQDALQLLLDRSLILANEEAARRELSDALKRERIEQIYDAATEKLVGIFQGERGLQASGEVDEPTADALTALLKELGLLEPAAVPKSHIVSGEVRREDGLLMQGLPIHAVHESDAGDIKLGEDTTDAEGRYTIRYQLLPGLDDINLRVSAIGEDGILLKSSDLIRSAQPLEMIDLAVPMVGQPAPQRRIEGHIVLEHGLPAERVKLRLYRRDFGGNDTLLGETRTLEGGQYAFTYGPGAKGVSLEVRAVNDANEEIPLSKPLNDLSGESRAVLNLLAPGALQPLAAEYRRLSTDLTPHVGQMTKLADARENSERQDLTVLNRATGWDSRLIALAATTERLSADADVELPQEALYGLLRAGLPSDKLLLAQVEPDVAEQALQTVRDAGIVDLTDQQIGQFKQQFTTFANKARMVVPAPGSSSTYGELLKASGLDDAAQAKFAAVYLSHRGDAAQLWDKALQAGLDDTRISKLQLQGKLAFLAGNSEAMTSRLVKMQFKDPVQLVEQDFHRPDQWKAEITALAGNDEQKLAALIPTAYLGDKVEDRLEAYAEDMARKVRLSYPTQVVGRMIEQDNADAFKLGAARGSTATLLKNAAGQGFRLGRTPVAAFLKTHAGVAAGMADNEFQSAQQQMMTMQRVYQITPSNEAMPVLLSLQMTSAYDVTAYSEEVFVELYAAKYFELYGKASTLAEARLVYRKARQVSSVTYNLFTIAKKLDSEAPVYGLSAPVEEREIARNKLIQQFPTMESLFGSMDFCECEHCRSVLSPAAYLVDLLQFVDAEPEVWGNFLAHWKATHNNQDYTAKYKKPYDALVERRPDLPHIPLTCENTHTALPYIDIVNEILEYYVANGKLEEKAARDTGEATTAELLAEPQNVIREAYDKLREAHYPLNLPFDLWIETVRQFCNYFETPLARVLEVFRASDDLFAPTQPFDRSNIFVESLWLSPAEAAIFTDPDPLSKWHELYGFKTALEATTKATDATTGQRIDLNSAKALSRRLGVTYQEIVDIVQTGFVNPKLEKLGVLYNLGASIHDARFYIDNRGLLQQDPTTLSTEDQKRRLEVEAFAQELENLADVFMVPKAQLEAELQAIPFDGVLLLADPEAGCDFDLTTLRYADGSPADRIAFLRINLFVRLWRKLGWSIEETDRALQAFVPMNTPFETAHLDKQPLKTALIYLAHLKALDEKVRVGKQARLKLITLWSDITITGKKPLYAQLLLTRSVLKSDPVFDDPRGHYLLAAGIAAMAESRRHMVQLEKVVPAGKIDSAPFAAEPKVELSYDALLQVQHLSFEGVLSNAEKAALSALSASPALPTLLDAVQVKAQEFSLIKGHMLALQGALSLIADEIGRILEDAGKSLDTAELSLPNVSLLYRYGLLAKALKLSVRDLIALKQLSGLDPFKLLHSDPLTTLDEDYPFTQTLRFVEVAEEVKESGLKIEDLEYLLRHRIDETGKYRPNREGTLALLKTLAEGIRTIRAEHVVPDDPDMMSDEMLRQKLGLALPPDVVERFLAMMNGTAEFTATKTGVELVDKLKPEIFADETIIREVSYKERPDKEQKLTLRGVLFAAQVTELETRFNAVLTAAQRPVFSELLIGVQDKAKEFFQKHLQKQAPNFQPATGFLDAADFDLLFDQDLALAAGEREQDRIRNRRTKLANGFLPFLQERLIRQFIVQTMTAHTGADPVLVESLLTDERLLGDPKPLLDAFAATGKRGIVATFFASVDGTGAALASVSLADANTGLKDKDGNPLKPAGANSARIEGYLEVPTPGAYRFNVALDKQHAETELRFDHLPEPLFWSGTAATDNTALGDKPEEYLELKPGVPYRFTLYLRKLNGGDARLLVQGETLPKGSLARLTLYYLSAMDRAERAVVLLNKALQLLENFGLSERESRYLLTHPGAFDGLSLSKLPTATSDDTLVGAKALFGQFLRLAGYSRLKRDLAGGTDDLIDVFEANGTGDLDKVYPLIAKLTRRHGGTVRATANALFTAPGFASEKPFQRLWQALQVVERFGVPVASLLEWTRIVRPTVIPGQHFEIARELKEAIKARFEPESWQRVAQLIFDKLRQRQRDALVSHVMHQHGFARREQLYEYFLIDPGMEPVVQTSRIRLAIASLQLFIQRCLLNLEPQVHPSVINSKQWEWMKRYRVWEANRKIFLFPENWLEPEFRDDKTHLFVELEGALLQGDVSSDLVEDALLNYLKKLDELARLDIVAMHLEDDPDPTLRTLHVIGRTFSEAHKYFYRRYAHQMWTPWEPVSAEIEGDHLAPVVWRDRLYLFWVTFMDKPAENGAPTGTAAGVTLANLTLSSAVSGMRTMVANKEVEVQLHWSEYLQGEWSTRESGGFSAVLSETVPQNFKPRSVPIHVSKFYDKTGEEGGVYVHLGGGINRTFFLAGRNSAPESKSYSANSPRGDRPANPYKANTVRATRYSGGGPFTVVFKQRITTEPHKAPLVETPSILQEGSEYTLLPCDNNIILGAPDPASLDANSPAAVAAAIESGLPEIASLIKPLFYQDNAHTLFVEPDVTERTIEEWQGWVAPTPRPEPDWTNPDWWKDIIVIPKVPWKDPIPDPKDRWIIPIDPGSLINTKPEIDWLVNPGTVLLFDGVLIGPVGRPGVEILTTDAADVIAQGGAPVKINPGSGVASGSTAVLTDPTAFERNGLTQVAGGLNVIGGDGFNSALGQNFNELSLLGFGAALSGAGLAGR